MLLRITAAALIFLVFVSGAEARQRHHRATGLDPSCNVTMPCASFMSAADVAESQRVARGKHIVHEMGIGGVVPRRQALHSSEIIAHPAGCPRVAFCGCGAAVRIFGRPVRALWLAANWFRFPRAHLAPGTVAVRRHHVFVVERVLGGGRVLAYDANSGRHLTRVHARSVAGYTIVDPRG